MSYNSCSGNFSHSLGDHLSYPGSSCGSSYPSNLVYSTDCCSPSTCQPSCVVFSPCLMSCYSLRTSMLCRHFQITYYGSLDCGSIRGCSLDYGSRSSSSLGCGSSVFRPLCYGVHGFPSLIYGSRFYYPTYLASRSFQSSGYRATYRSAFCR
ncbi:hypothetical protein DBR06_SOUSAS4710050, partial [Sousa chinensis]